MVESRLDLSFRPLSIEDAELIDSIATSAFGPSEHRLSEIRRYLTLEPNYWLSAVVGNQPVGVVGATDYGPFTYLGMMTVRKEFQRKGIGRALFRRELKWLDEIGVSALRLDATDEGFPTYHRSGFEVFDEAIMFELSELPDSLRARADVRVLEASGIGRLTEFDVPVFGADRTRHPSSPR